MRLKENIEEEELVAKDGSHWGFHALRVSLGVVFLYAGLIKVFDPASLSVAVANYKITPFDQQPLDMWLGYFLPVIETLVGLGLLLQVWQRGAALLSGLMSLSFFAAIISVWIRGLDIHCGCFGDNEVFDGYFLHCVLLFGMILVSFYLWRKGARFQGSTDA